LGGFDLLSNKIYEEKEGKRERGKEGKEGKRERGKEGKRKRGKGRKIPGVHLLPDWI